MYSFIDTVASTRLVAEHPLASLIVLPDSGIDSVELHSWSHFPRDFVCKMKQNCGKLWHPKSFKPFDGCTKHRMWLHQPRREAIEALSGHDCDIVNVQVNLDLLTRSNEDAQHLHAVVTRHLMTNARPTEATVQYKNSTYYNHGRRHGPRKNLVAYSDRRSKIVPSSDCSHVELRIAGARNLEAAGLRHPADLLNLDHREFWKKNIRLVNIPSAEEMGLAWCRHFEKTRIEGKSRRFPFGTRENSIRRIGHRFERMVALDESGYFRAHDLEYMLRSDNVFGGTIPSNLFSSAGLDLILPGRENGHWRTS